MATTAEGVETREQLQRLREEGCTEVQGYLFSPPKPAKEVGAMLRRIRREMKRVA
jgi:EAL domain-containing protein (putative c-di-GMP-specific phosphodiesterase class I)